MLARAGAELERGRGAEAAQVLAPALRYLGAAYILYLAYGILRASYTFTERGTKPLGFGHGLLLLQLDQKAVGGRAARAPF